MGALPRLSEDSFYVNDIKLSLAYGHRETHV